MRGTIFLFVCLLALSGCAWAGADMSKEVGSVPSPSTEAAAQTKQGDNSAAQSVPPLLETGEACGTDGKPACPLVKPTQSMTPKYDRTPKQQAEMEAFDQLTLEEKFIALDQGLIVCTEFIHDEAWEHQIDPALIAFVGQEKFDQWMDLNDGCHSIYNFANAFLLTYNDLEKIIQEENLDLYPLADLKTGMDKWCAA